MIANILSLAVIPYSVTPFLILYLTDQWIYGLWGILVLLASVTTSALKGLTRDSSHVCLKRPTGAKDCNVLNNDGDREGEPGFPSGHCATTAAFWCGALLLAPSWGLLLVGTLATGAMMWARMKKRCHTLLQVIGGCGVGVIVSLGLL
jgi:membrane-associated phospholipid phosphatase